jgi:hypothetical protein
MLLATTHLFLNKINENDINDIHTLLSLPETDEYNTMGIPKNIEATQTFMNIGLQSNKPNLQKHIYIV